MGREIKFRAFYDNRMHDNQEAMRILYNNATEFPLTPKYPIMQFTGLKDKNGKEIYEGDVITCGKGICSVGWEDGGFAFCNNKNWLDEWNWADDSHRFKVIGNIYSNPELIN